MLIHATELGCREDSSTDSIPLNPHEQIIFYVWRNSLVSETARKELQLAFCPGCGTFLQKAAIAQSEMICPCCGKDVVVSIKNGKVIVFESRRESEQDPEYMMRVRAMTYLNRMRKAK